jgi:hypothetical protein
LAARARAILRPMPRDAPVITATLSFGIIYSFHLLKGLLIAFAFKMAHISGQTFEVFKTSKVFKMST